MPPSPHLSFFLHAVGIRHPPSSWGRCLRGKRYMAPSLPPRDDFITSEMLLQCYSRAASATSEKLFFLCTHHTCGVRGRCLAASSVTLHTLLYCIIIIVIVVRERAHKNASSFRLYVGSALKSLPLYNKNWPLHSRSPSPGLSLEPVIWLSGG